MMKFDGYGWLIDERIVMGPVAKAYPGTNSMEVFVGHSMEGWWETGGKSVLANMQRGSWHFTILTSGQIIQHYSLFARPWSSGNQNINERSISCELEGVAGQEPTGAQKATARALLAALSNFSGRKYLRVPPEAPEYTEPFATLPANEGRLTQHNEVDTWISRNAGDTACPSGRWNWLLNEPQQLEQTGDEPMTPAERARLERLEAIVAGNGIDVPNLDPHADAPDRVRLTGNDALEYLAKDGASLALGQGILQGEMIEVRKALGL